MSCFRRLRDQGGSAVVTALMLVTMMLTTSLATIALVDNQQRESGRERKRESTFNLSEGVLNTQIFLLSRQWPGTETAQYPVACSRANATDPRCPDDPRLASSYRGPDYDRGITWTTEIRDNVVGSTNYYDDAVMGNAARWDANKDSYLWIRSSAVLPNGRQRVIVALVKAEELATNFPTHAVVAGAITLSQAGNHTYIYTSDDNNQVAGKVTVRCEPVGSSGCAQESKDQHISPAEVQSDPTLKPALTSAEIDRLREAAVANGTYFAKGTCPTSLQGKNPGEIVFVEYATGCSAHNSNTAVYNTSTNPGVLVIGSGSFDLAGPTFHGLIYHANGSETTTLEDDLTAVGGLPAMSVRNNSVVVGAIIIDGAGRLEVGNNNGTKGFPGNIVFNANSRNALKTFGTAGIVQNSFREIVPKR